MYDYNCPDCNEGKLQSDKNARKINEVIDQVNALIQVNNETVDFIEVKANELVPPVVEREVNNVMGDILTEIDNKANKNDELPVKELYSSYCFERKKINSVWHNYRIPSFIKTNSGKLFAVSDQKYNNMADLGCDCRIVGSTSIDDGKTWSEPFPILDFGFGNGADKGVGDPCIVYNSDTNRIFVFALRWADSSSAVANTDPNNPAYDFVYRYSDNEGQTWSDVISLKTLKKDNWHLLFNGPSVGFYSNNQILVPCQYWDENHVPHSTYIMSTNNGETWTLSSSGLPNQTTESTIVLNPIGEVVMNVRSDKRNQRTIMKKILNGWVDLGGNIADPICQSCVIKGDDELYYMTHQNITRIKNSSVRKRLCISYSKDGEKWTLLAVLHNIATNGYSSVVDLGENIGVIFEEVSGNVIFKCYSKKDLFSAKHKMFTYKAENLTQIEIKNNTLNKLYLEPETEVVYFSGTTNPISYISGCHNQKVRLMNLSTNEQIIDLTSIANDGIVKPSTNTSITLKRYESVDLCRYSTGWYIINTNLIGTVIRELASNFALQTDSITVYPKGDSIFYVTSGKWEMGTGVVRTVRIGLDDIYAYQEFNVRGMNEVWRRVPLTNGGWSEFIKLTN